MKENKTKTLDLYASPRDIWAIANETGNLYKSVVIAAKRANQIASEEKEEIITKLSEFAPRYDNIEEIYDNSEQTQISIHFEKRPKPTIRALQELINGEIYWRMATQEELEESKEE